MANVRVQWRYEETNLKSTNVDLSVARYVSEKRIWRCELILTAWRNCLSQGKDIEGLTDKMSFVSHGKPMNYLTWSGIPQKPTTRAGEFLHVGWRRETNDSTTVTAVTTTMCKTDGLPPNALWGLTDLQKYQNPRAVSSFIWALMPRWSWISKDSWLFRLKKLKCLAQKGVIFTCRCRSC